MSKKQLISKGAALAKRSAQQMDSTLSDEEEAFRNAVCAPGGALMRLGENGMPEHSAKSVGSTLLVLSQKVRGSDSEVTQLCREILYCPDKKSGAHDKEYLQNVVDLIVLTFVTRNCRGGKGEKKLSYLMFLQIFRTFPETAMALLSLFPHFGYYKDILQLQMMVKNEATLTVDQKDSFKLSALTLLKKQLQKDEVSLHLHSSNQTNKDTQSQSETSILPKNELKTTNGENNALSISLLAKWLPREGNYFDKKFDFIDSFCKLYWPEQTLDKNVDTNSIQGDTPEAPKKTYASVARMKEHDKVMDTYRFQTRKEMNRPCRYQARKRYRRIVARLTSFLDLPEVYLAMKREDEINFGKVASKATLRLSKAFMNEKKDGSIRSVNPKRIRLAERFTEHVLNHGAKGSQIMPHEIVSKIFDKRISAMDALLLDAQWKSLWDTVRQQIIAAEAVTTPDSNESVQGTKKASKPTRMIPMADVSGSMHGIPMLVSIALSIGLSEITHPAYQHLVLTFSEEPTFHQLHPANTIVEKVSSLQNAKWGMNTDFEAAYDLILDVAIQNNLSRKDVPALIVFSDMQFDEAARTNKSTMQTMHDVIRRKFAEAARKLGWEDATPTPIVYWNLRNTAGHPVNKDTEGAVMLSGFSPSLLKLVLSGDALEDKEIEVVQEDGSTITEKIRVTPKDILRNMLDDVLYDPVRKILAKSQEGILKEYQYKPSESTDDGSFEMKDFQSKSKDFSDDESFEMVL